MNSENQKPKHPFTITCRKCGSNNIGVYAHDYDDLEIRCRECGRSIECRYYYTMMFDYSEC